jgi:hypothetical protein
MTDSTTFPNDADGEVLQKMQDGGFDFSKKHDVDFMVEFSSWPPTDKAIDALEKHFETAELFDPEEGRSGYLLISSNGLITYDFVKATQKQASALVNQHGGRCKAWGVYQ